MVSMANRIENISDGLWNDIKVILEYMVIKNNLLAAEYETDQTKHDAIVYFSAVHHSGPLLLYKDHLTYDMMAQIMVGEQPAFIRECLKNPNLVPEKYILGILQLVEQEVIDTFVEKNNYYRMLLGLPPIDTPPSDFLYLKDETYENFGIQKILVDGKLRYPAIHELDSLTQELIDKTDDFQRIKDEHPDDEWLGFIGKNKIPLEQARSAKEFEVIRLFPELAMDINPELTTNFSNEYNRARDWFVRVMWNVELENASLNYRQFVAFSIVIKALRMTLNRQFDGIIENSFLNETLVTILFDLYRLPASVAQLSKTTRRQLALELRKLIRDRAGNKVLYDIARILGYDNIIISKIVLNKIQMFSGANEAVVHKQIANVQDPITGVTRTVDDPYHSFTRTMQAIDIKTTTPRDDIIQQRNPKDYVRDVTGPDPRWWEDENPGDPTGIYPSTADGFLRNNVDEVKRIEFNPKMFKEEIFGNPEADLPTKDIHDPDYDDVYWDLSTAERRHPSWYFPGWNSVDTKYMMLTYQYSMADKMFETIYLIRYLLDKQEQTETYLNKLNLYGGSQMHSLYNIVLFLVCGLNKLTFGSSPYEKNSYGEIINNNTNFRSILGFNVDLESKDINDYLSRCDYLDAGYVKSLIEETALMEQNDIKSAYAVGILGLRDYLVTKMELARTITEWREANKLYSMMFTYDPVRDIHAKPGTKEKNEENAIPDIRYKIYDMEVVLFGYAQAPVGSQVKITVKTVQGKSSVSHTIVVGYVSKVENGYVTEVNFRYPNALDNFNALPTWNNTAYNKAGDINLISDEPFDHGDLYNPSGQNGPSIESGAYLATVGNSAAGGMYIRVTDTWFHTRDIYEKYMDELLERDPYLGRLVNGTADSVELAKALSEACDLISEITDQDLNYLRELLGGENNNNVLMDMIKYIKSYTIDFITSEKKYVLGDKRNPEWLKLIDGVEFDPRKPITIQIQEDIQLYDAIRFDIQRKILCDGKQLPKDELDFDPFTQSKNYLRDALIKIPEKRGITYYYEITEANIIQFMIPEDAQLGDKFTDYLTIRMYQGEEIQLPVEIYLGDNPNPGQIPEWYYHYSGFTFRTNKLTEEILPIMVAINHNEIPYPLKPDAMPEYGVYINGENGYCIGEIYCRYVRSDLDNPQISK